MRKQKKKFTVKLPSILPIQGYNNLKLKGDSMAYSPRQAVSQFIARQNPSLVSLVMHNLDEEGRAESYVSVNQLPIVEVYQTEEDLLQGERLTDKELKLMQEYAKAYELMQINGADTLSPQSRFEYLSVVRNSKQGH